MAKILLVFTAFTALAIALTWPLFLDLGAVVPSDLGDPVLNTWILWWNAGHVPLTASWWNASFFFPAAGVLAFSEHLLGLSVIASPVIWLTGSPLLGYNVTFLLTFPLSATAACLLGLELTGRRDAAFLAGLIFGFSPFRMGQLSHLQVLASFWLPVALLALHRHARTREWKWLPLFGAALVMQALSNGYYLAFAAVLIAFWIVWFVRPAEWRLGARVAIASAAGVVVLLPVLWHYRTVHNMYSLARSAAEVRGLTADIAAPLNASPLMAWWGNLHVYERNEGALFPGAMALLLVAAGVVAAIRTHKENRSLFWFYVAGGFLMYLLALGPSPTLMGKPFLPTGPYAWLQGLPVFSSLRAPARFGMLLVLCLSAAAAIGYAWMTANVTRARRWSIAVVLALVIAGESWPRGIPVWEPPRAWDLQPSDVSGALLVLPVLNEINDAGTMYRAMSHGRPTVNGYSGHFPPWYRTLKESLNALDPAALDVLASAGVTQIAVVLRNDEDGTWRRLASTRAKSVRVSDDGRFELFNLPAPVQTAPRQSQEVIPIAGITASPNPHLVFALTDGDATTRWYSEGAQTGTEQLDLDLGSVVPFSTVELWLGHFDFEHPRELIIETSSDRAAWTQVWRGAGGPAAIAGAMASPERVPLSFRIGECQARYIRLRQVGRHRSSMWSVAELRVRR